MSTHLASPAEADILDVLRRALDQAPAPRTAEQLRKDLMGPNKLPAQRLASLLEELASGGRIHRYAPATARGKSPRFWTRPPEDIARGELLRHLSGPKALTEAEVLKKARAAKTGVADDRLRLILQGLVNSGEVRTWPGKKKNEKTKFSTRPPEPRDYLKKPLDDIIKIFRTLEPAGVTREQVIDVLREHLGAAPAVAAVAIPVPMPVPVAAGPARAPEPPAPEPRGEELGQLILECMAEAVPAAVNGALVPIRDLRRALDLQQIDKVTFDEAVLRLARRGVVALHRHDYPAGLSEPERAEMVPDGAGGYYIGIALRG